MFRRMNERVVVLPPAPGRFPGAATVICLLAGVMLTTAMPPLRGTAVLAPAALMLLFQQLRAAPRPGWLAFVFGFGHAATLMSWLFFLDPAKSIPSRALVPVQALAAILFVAAHYWLFGVAVGWLRRRMSPWLLLAVLPVLWTALELLRSVGELGFPWCLTGAAWLHTPLRTLYRAAGEAGLGAATALLAAAGVALMARWRHGDESARGWRALLVVAVLAWLLLWWGSTVMAPRSAPGQRTAPLTVACVQANVPQAIKWDPAHIDSTRIPYAEHTAAAAAAGAQLVVWAETAIPAYVRYDREMLDWVRGVARGGRTAVLAGFPDGRYEDDPADGDERRLLKFNAAGLFDAQGTLVETYGKHHLVPIGEAMPFQRYLPFLGGIDVGQAEWTPGAPPGPMTLATPRGEVALASLICFEAVFSDLARGAVRRGASVLVNITNDGWFGYSAGPRQHAALARIRGIECGVPLVRCSNNGISLIADGEGRVIDALGLDRRGRIEAAIVPVARGTPYVRWGLWPLLAYLAIWVLAARVLDRRAGSGAAS
jgi:apolipoprotein N-acyltransferase